MQYYSIPVLYISTCEWNSLHLHPWCGTTIGTHSSQGGLLPLLTSVRFISSEKTKAKAGTLSQSRYTNGHRSNLTTGIGRCRYTVGGRGVCQWEDGLGGKRGGGVKQRPWRQTRVARRWWRRCRSVQLQGHIYCDTVVDGRPNLTSSANRDDLESCWRFSSSKIDLCIYS